MGDIGAIVRGIAGVKDFAVARRFDPHLPFLHCEKFAGAFEVRRATESAARLQLNFVELDVFFQIQWRECANAAMFVGTIMVGVIFGANDGDGAGRVGGFQEIAETHVKGAGDPEGDGEGGVGLVAFDLAEHGTADAAGVGEGFEGPIAVGAEAFDAVPKVMVDRIGRRRSFVFGWHI